MAHNEVVHVSRILTWHSSGTYRMQSLKMQSVQSSGKAYERQFHLASMQASWHHGLDWLLMQFSPERFCWTTGQLTIEAQGFACASFYAISCAASDTSFYHSKSSLEKAMKWGWCLVLKAFFFYHYWGLTWNRAGKWDPTHPGSGYLNSCISELPGDAIHTANQSEFLP